MHVRWWKYFVILAALLAAASCSAPAVETRTPQPVVVSVDQARYPRLFVQATTCAGCHDNIQDGAGNTISIARDWSASMHAISARDPYFLAAVRSEVEHHPQLAEVIEETCATCHMPMARTTALAVNETAAMLDEGFLDTNHPLNSLGVDGVSCLLCHQVQRQGLGEKGSFNGSFAIDLRTPPGERDLFGPFEVSASTAQLKKAVIDSLVKQSGHLGTAEFCAVCHTLYTPVVDDAGDLQEKPFPEQMVYLEWQNSDFAGQVSCQSCHMPRVEGSTMLANIGGLQPRQPVNQHTFIGANSYILEIAGEYREALELNGQTQSFQAAAQASRAFLSSEAAVLSATAEREGSSVRVVVRVESLTGHKLPSAYPSRRAWLHLTVTDAAGGVQFESGQYSPDGKITENDNDQDADRFEPHYDLISEASQVQIYEAIMGDTNGGVTTALLRANRYLKDNRLLPDGFDKAGAVEEIRVRGLAADDETFAAGGDTVTYQIETSSSGPLIVSVELLYQPIGFRWAENVRGDHTPEGEAFLTFIDARPPLPVLMAEATVTIP